MVVVADRRARRLEHVLGRRQPGVRVLEPERALGGVRRVGDVGHRHPQHALHALGQAGHAALLSKRSGRRAA